MNTRVSARLLASVTALTLAAPALAQDNGGASDFELPSDRPTTQGRAQGPVLDGIPAPRVARPSPSPVAPPVIEVDPGASQLPDPLAAIDAMGRDRPAAQRPAASATAAPQQTAAGEPAVAAEAPATATVAGPSIDLPVAPAAAVPTTEPQPLAPTGGVAWWIWALALLGVGVLGTAIGWFVRGRRTEVLYLPASEIERPKVPERAAPELTEELPQPAPTRAPPPLPERTGPPADLPKVALSRRPVEPPPPPLRPPPPVDHDDDDDEEQDERPLRIALEPARLSVSLLNATLAYRILLTNRGEDTLRDISIDGDMISAHASLTREDQLAAPNSKLENRHLVRTLAPGETQVVNGEFALPLPLIRPIRKGDATLFVPLARLRVVAGGESTDVLVQTSVVGQRSLNPGGGLRPFRLDLGPRIYSELGQRAFA